MSNIKYEVFTGTEAQLLEAVQPIDEVKIPWPANSIIEYAIEDNEIIGRMALLEVPHIEGTWIREDKRNSTILIKLITKLESSLEESGKTHVFVFSAEDKVSEYLKRLGYSEMPVKVFMKPLVDLEKKDN